MALLRRLGTLQIYNLCPRRLGPTFKQEAQLPQRNSASAAHMEGEGGLDLPAHSPFASSGYTYMPMVESESHNVHTSSVPSVKRT